MKFPNLNALVLNQKLLLEPNYASQLVGFLASRSGYNVLNYHHDDEEEQFDMANERAPYRDLRWYIHPEHQHVGVVPIHGTLSQRQRFGIGSMGPSYESVTNDYRDAMNHEGITAVGIDIQSNGGVASGSDSLVNFLLQEQKKPVWVLSNEQAFSAGYKIASVFSRNRNNQNRIVGLPGSEFGSIGSVIPFMEKSKQVEDEGYNVQIFRSGERKFRGNMIEPLDSVTAAEMQSDVDADAGRFFEHVSMHTGVPVEAIRGLEGGKFSTQRGIELGLVDQVLSSEHEFYQLLADTYPPEQVGIQMAGPAPAQQPAAQPFNGDPSNTGTGTSIPAAQPVNAGISEEERQKILDEGAQKERDRIENEKRQEEEQARIANAAKIERETDISNWARENNRENAAKDFFDEESELYQVEPKTAIAMLKRMPEDTKNDDTFEREMGNQSKEIGRANGGGNQVDEDDHLMNLVQGFAKDNIRNLDYQAAVVNYADKARTLDKTHGKAIFNRARAAMGKE